ncbi:hypothetical protein ABZ092_35955 [Streptomyces bobili]|uniref:hypothetical protein n=1 Tax=Streptomyces bobili TaxID=67280 RepID=UPI0033BF2CA6
MSNGWNWIAEGERISAESRRLAGLTEEVRAESIVFNCQALHEGDLDTLKVAGIEVLAEENRRLREENAALRAAQPKTVAALHEALVHLGEGV